MKFKKNSYITENTLFLKRIKSDPYYIGDISIQTPELCMAAIEKDWFSFRFILNQTFDVCRFALEKSGGYALQFIRHQTPELCEEAVKQGVIAGSDLSDIIYSAKDPKIRDLLFHDFLR